MRSRFEQSYEIYRDREGVGLCNGRAKKFVVLYLDCAFSNVFREGVHVAGVPRHCASCFHCSCAALPCPK